MKRTDGDGFSHVHKKPETSSIFSRKNMDCQDHIDNSLRLLLNCTHLGGKTMYRSRKLRFAFKVVLTLILIWSSSCTSLDPPVPEHIPELRSSLSGCLIMDCLDPQPTVYELDASRDHHTSLLIPDCDEKCFEVSFSADGEKALYLEKSTAGNMVRQFDFDSRSSQMLLYNEEPIMSLSWSPNGDMIAYEVLRDSYIPLVENDAWKDPNAPPDPIPVYRHSTLHIYNLANGSEIQLTPSNGNVSTYNWSPSGDQIVISARLEDLNQDGTIDFSDPARLYIITISTQTLEPFAPQDVSRMQMLKPSWSFDGQYITYVTDIDRLVIVSTTTGSEIAHFDVSAGRVYRWAPNALKIAYIGATFPEDSVVGYKDLYLFDLATGANEQLTNTSTRTVFGCWDRNGISFGDLLWSPDSKYVALVWRTEGKEHLVVSCVDNAQLTWVTELEPYCNLVMWEDR
jgi:Tol biopolymer transport system component